jgi:hypothetical protein
VDVRGSPRTRGHKPILNYPPGDSVEPREPYVQVFVESAVDKQAATIREMITPKLPTTRVALAVLGSAPPKGFDEIAAHNAPSAHMEESSMRHPKFESVLDLGSY